MRKTLFVKDDYEIVRCLSCGLVYLGNPPEDNKRKELYSFASGYHECFKNPDSYQTRRHLDIARKRYKCLRQYKEKGRILDIGCSAGFFLKVAKENSWETWGVEISDDTSEIARKRYGLDILSGPLGEDSFIAGSFDVVTLWDIIEHVKDPLKTMYIVNRILKDNGMVFISTPNICGLFAEISYRLAHITGDWFHPDPPHHLYQFSKTTLKRLLKTTGFKIIRSYDARIPISYTFRDFAKLNIPLTKILYSSFLVPFSFIGPLVHSGDMIMAVAEKVRNT